MGTSTISIDWEDFSQQYGKYHFGNFTEPLGGAIERQTNIILDLLDENHIKATFFILGKLAGYRPALVQLIASRGHEIALHGQNHEVMFTLSRDEARADVAEALQTVQDITGAAVYGYRAPFFSIKKDNLYLLETLTELGLLYDSSIFPTAISRYGIKNFSKEDMLYSLPNGKQIVELAMTTGKFLNREWPLAGGGYFRLLPGFMINRVFRKISAQGGDSMIYMHPYEFDNRPIDVTVNYPAEAKYSALKAAALNFRWNLFRPSITGKMRALLSDLQFSTCIEKAKAVKKNCGPVYLDTAASHL